VCVCAHNMQAHARGGYRSHWDGCPTGRTIRTRAHTRVKYCTRGIGTC